LPYVQLCADLIIPGGDMDIQTINLDEKTTLVLEVESTESYKAFTADKDKQFAELWDWVDQQANNENTTELESASD